MRQRTLLLAILLLLTTLKSGAQELMVINSKNLKCNDTILVFTPKTIVSADSLPTMILLHGWSGCYKDWSSHYDLQEISNRSGFRIICPDGFYNSWYLDNLDPSKMQWRKFFHEEFYPQMKTKYSLVPKYTFITGLSMGGHGAINLFLDNPTLFRSAGSMSGVLDLRMTGLRKEFVSQIIGEYSEENKNYDKESALNRLEQYRKDYPTEAAEKVFVISCGYEDIYEKCALDFTYKCKEYNIPCIGTLNKGKHSWKYWGFTLEQHLWVFTKILKGENLGY